MRHGSWQAGTVFTKRMLAFFLLLWFSLAPRTTLGASEPVGKVDWLEGKVTVERAGYAGAAAVGDPVYLYDKWQTEPNTGAELVFLDQSRVRMGPAASLEITEYLYQPQEKSRNSLISMMSGKVRFVVQDLQEYKDKRFRVQTQTAIVGTRGTEFVVWIDSPCGPTVSPKDCVYPSVTRVLAIANEITFTNVSFPGNPVTLSPGMTSQTQSNVLPTPPAVAPPEVRQEMIKGTEPAPVSRDSQAATQPTQSKPATTTTTTSSGGVYQEVQREEQETAAAEKTETEEPTAKSQSGSSATADKGSQEINAAKQAGSDTTETQAMEKSAESQDTPPLSAALGNQMIGEEGQEAPSAPATQALFQATEPMQAPPPPPPEVPTVVSDSYDPTASSSTGR